jgi:hypothetical protein
MPAASVWRFNSAYFSAVVNLRLAGLPVDGMGLPGLVLGCLENTPAGFEPAANPLEAGCSIRTELRGQLEAWESNPVETGGRPNPAGQGVHPPPGCIVPQSLGRDRVSLDRREAVVYRGFQSASKL